MHGRADLNVPQARAAILIARPYCFAVLTARQSAVGLFCSTTKRYQIMPSGIHTREPGGPPATDVVIMQDCVAHDWNSDSPHQHRGISHKPTVTAPESPGRPSFVPLLLPSAPSTPKRPCTPHLHPLQPACHCKSIRIYGAGPAASSSFDGASCEYCRL